MSERRIDPTNPPTCGICGEPMPPGEGMFKYHGYSGPCPKPPIPRRTFKKKPVVIEAFQLTELTRATNENWPEWLHRAWNGNAGEAGTVSPWELGRVDGPLRIVTLEGDHQCNIGDWIIRGIRGELYPCKPDIFLETYEPTFEPITSFEV